MKLLSKRPRNCNTIHILGDNYDTDAGRSLKFEEHQRQQKDTVRKSYIPHPSLAIPKWNDFVNKHENADKKLNVLAKLKYLLDRKTLTTMYTSFIRPGLEYASIVFCNCSETEEDILESVQKRAFKIITGGIVRTPTNYLYNEIGLETLKTRRDRNVLLFFFKIMHNMVPG